MMVTKIMLSSKCVDVYRITGLVEVLKYKLIMVEAFIHRYEIMLIEYPLVKNDPNEFDCITISYWCSSWYQYVL